MRTSFATFFFSIVACLLGAAQTMSAQTPGFEGGFAGAGPKVAVELALEPATARPGELVTIRATLSVTPGWHIYGFLQNPEMGSPTEFTLEKHEGVEPFGPAWIPAGVPHDEDDLMTHHLYGDVELIRRVYVPEGAEPGAVELAGQLVYMVCDERSCDPVADESWKKTLTIESGKAREAYARKKVELLGARVRGGVRSGEAVDVGIDLWVKPGFHIFGSKEETSVVTNLEVTNAADIAKEGAKPGKSFVPAGQVAPGGGTRRVSVLPRRQGHDLSALRAFEICEARKRDPRRRHRRVSGL